MKYIKLYEENIIFKYKIGDYVIANNLSGDWVDSNDNEVITKKFLENEVGQIVYNVNLHDRIKNIVNWYDVEYKNIPEEIEDDIQSIIRDDNRGNGLLNMWSFEEDEIRLATKQEIETQNIKNDTYNVVSKYNL